MNSSIQTQISELKRELEAMKAVNNGTIIPRFATSAPTSSTVGAVGTILVTVVSGTTHIYVCKAKNGSTYTWQLMV